MCFVPLSERSGINNNNGVLYQSLGTHQFIVTSIINDIDYASLARSTFRAPSEISAVQTQRPVFDVTSARADIVNPTSAKLSVGCGPT